MTEASIAQHPAFDHYAVKDGCLQIGGIPLTRLADRIGQTPFFAYDRALITARINHLKRVLPAEIALHYAIKANPMPAVVQHLAGLVDGFDVASVAEMQVALDTPMPADRIAFAGPGKRLEELERAVAAGIIVEMESAHEMRQLAAIGDKRGVRPRVAIRVNPNFELKGSGMRMGGGQQQFGVDADLVPELLREVAGAGLDFSGFHIFAGSQNLHQDSILAAQEQTIDLAITLAEYAPQPVRHLNLGGGFGIPYFPKDVPLDIAPIGDNLKRLIKDRLKPALPEAHPIIELGRYIVGEAGLYVTRVVDRKISRGHVFLVTDGGLHHQLAASGNFGQIIRRNYPVAIANRMDHAETETASVVGCLCTPLDLLADKAQLAKADIGDLVVVFQSGAYGLTASPINFLSHPAPAEVLV